MFIDSKTVVLKDVIKEEIQSCDREPWLPAAPTVTPNLSKKVYRQETEK